MAKIPRSRYWASILYPESCKGDFIDLLKEQHVNFLLSPLHDTDVDKDGVLKKAHYHLMLCFDGPTSDQVADIIFSSLGGVGCVRVSNCTSYSRYLCHMDDPDKAQYSPDDVVSYGVDYADYIQTPDSRYDDIGGIIDFCEQNQITNFAHLLMSLRRENMHLFKVCCDHSYLVKSFVSEFRKGCGRNVNKTYGHEDDYNIGDGFFSASGSPFTSDSSKS